MNKFSPSWENAKKPSPSRNTTQSKRIFHEWPEEGALIKDHKLYITLDDMTFDELSLVDDEALRHLFRNQENKSKMTEWLYNYVPKPNNGWAVYQDVGIDQSKYVNIITGYRVDGTPKSKELDDERNRKILTDRETKNIYVDISR